MAILEPVVVSSGSLIAAMLYQQACAPNDQDGFFLGKIENSVTDKISDAEIGEKEENLFINIYDFIPCPTTFFFYDNIGHLKKESLQTLFNGKEKEVVGWYKIRRNSSHRVSFRENAIHKNLNYLIDDNLNLLKKAFLFGLFTSESLQNGALFSTQHSFFVKRVDHFEVLKWKTSNLHSDEGTQYKHFNTSAVNRDEPTFKALMNAVEQDTDPNNMVQRGINFIEYFNRNIKNLREELTLKEETIFSLNEEIKFLETLIPTPEKSNSTITKSKEAENSQKEPEPNKSVKSMDETFKQEHEKAVMIDTKVDGTATPKSDLKMESLSMEENSN